MPTQLANLEPQAGALIDIGELRAEIVKSLLDEILTGIHVHLDTPEISPPNVVVNPQVTVEPADATITMPGLEVLSAKLDQIANQLGIIVNLLGSPEVTTVTRGSEGITEMVRRRG